MEQFGLPGDIPLVGFFDSDDVHDKVVWRPSTGMWFIRPSSGGVDTVIQWGLPGDVPVVADFDGDATDDPAVWRPSNGTWYILLSSQGYSNLPEDILVRQWGLPEDHPLSGDFDGDKRADLVVWRPNTGMWFVCSSQHQYQCQYSRQEQFGLFGDLPLQADFDGDDVLDPAVWRPHPGGGMLYYLGSQNGQAVQQAFGSGMPGTHVPFFMGMKDRVRTLYPE